MDIVITNHAKFEAQRRQVDLELVSDTARNPQQKVPSQKNRIICQRKYYDKIGGKEMLLRVITEQSGTMIKVISVYRTSKVDKYWRTGD